MTDTTSRTTGVADAAAFEPGFETPAFHAPGARERQHPAGAEVHAGLVYACIDGYRPLELDVFVPSGRSGPVPCVVWIHGGAWLFGARAYPPEAWPAGALFQALIDAGLAVATIDYRHSREAPFPAQLHDAKSAVRYLRRFAAELGIDPGRVAAWGESAGGHLAALLALVDDPSLEGTVGVVGPSSTVSAVVDFYGVADVDTMPSLIDSMPAEWVEELRRAAGDLPPEPIDVLLRDSPLPAETARRLLSPVHHVSGSAPPFLLVHGDADGLVPVGQSERLRSALYDAGADAELVTVPGADHAFLGADPIPLILLATEFLSARLLPRTTNEGTAP